jgi:hypothetical protein
MNGYLASGIGRRRIGAESKDRVNQGLHMSIRRSQPFVSAQFCSYSSRGRLSHVVREKKVQPVPLKACQGLSSLVEASLKLRPVVVEGSKRLGEVRRKMRRGFSCQGPDLPFASHCVVAALRKEGGGSWSLFERGVDDC